MSRYISQFGGNFKMGHCNGGMFITGGGSSKIGGLGHMAKMPGNLAKAEKDHSWPDFVQDQAGTDPHPPSLARLNVVAAGAHLCSWAASLKEPGRLRFSSSLKAFSRSRMRQPMHVRRKPEKWSRYLIDPPGPICGAICLKSRSIFVKLFFLFKTDLDIRFFMS